MAKKDGATAILSDSANSEREKSMREEAFEKLITSLLSTDDLETKTELTMNQIVNLSRGRLFAKTFNCEAMESLVNDIMLLSISKSRKGREELVRMAQNMPEDRPEEKDSLLRSLAGMGGGM